MIDIILPSEVLMTVLLMISSGAAYPQIGDVTTHCLKKNKMIQAEKD